MVYVNDYSYIKVVAWDENSITFKVNHKHYTFGKSDTIIFLVDPFAGQLDSIARIEKFTFDDFMDMLDCSDTKEEVIDDINNNLSSMGAIAIGIE